MKKFLLALLIMPFLALISCSDDDDDDDEGNWVNLSEYEGNTRTGAVSFQIGEFAYIGLGTDGDEYFQDFWRYDASRNFWEEMASFPGSGRISAVAFDLNGKGYVGTGFNDDLEVEELGDFWEYDPDTDSWSEIAEFSGTPRYSAVSFTLDGLGYVGTGYDGSFLKDFYAYDPTTDSWSQTLSLFGSKRESAFAFVIDGLAYVGSGTNNSQYLYDFWAFDPSADTWIDYSINDDDNDYYEEFIVAMQREDAVAFVMDDIAYITTGQTSTYLGDVVSFDPSANVWNEDHTDFEGTARGGAVAFVINGQGYVATGRSSTSRHDDIWAFKPFDEYEEFD